jgi:transposase-like protein
MGFFEDTIRHQKIWLHRMRGDSYEQIAEDFDVSREIIFKIVRQYQRTYGRKTELRRIKGVN